MGVKYFKANLSEISKSHYLFGTYNFFRLRKLIDNDLFFHQVRLSDYFEIISGYAFSSKDYLDEGGIPVCRIGDISKLNELLIDEMLRLPEEYANDYEKYALKNGDILIGLTGDGKFFKTCFVENLEIPILLNQRVGIIRVKENITTISAKFVSLLFNSDKVQNQIRIVAMGKTQKNVSPFDILNIKIPKLDFNTQLKLLQETQPIEIEITNLKNSKLKSLDIINQVFGEEFGFDWQFYKEFGKGMTAGTQQSHVREKAMYQVSLSQIAKSNILRISSRFHSPKTQFLNKVLFSKPTNKIKNIITEKVHRGVSPIYNAEGEIPVVKTAHLKNGYLDISQEEFVTEEFYTKNIRSQIQQNDVLIASTGKVSLGKVDFVETDENLVIDGHISVIRINETKYNALFLTYFLRSILGTFQIERDFTGATNQIELYSAEIEYFDIPDFPLAKQGEIVEKIKTQIDAQNVIDKQIAEKQGEINGIIEKAIT
jgi:type I restriction enzyme S subunit